MYQKATKVPLSDMCYKYPMALKDLIKKNPNIYNLAVQVLFKIKLLIFFLKSHLLLCFPGTCPALSLSSLHLVIPLVHLENRSILHSCCLGYPEKGRKKKFQLFFKHF